MTDEEMRIAIAEACGWARDPEWNAEVWIKGVQQANTYTLPDYPNDLNACHEIEEGFVGGMNEMEYMDELFKVVFAGDEYELDCTTAFDLLHATARQRCEAFLRTIGKWKEAR